MDDDERGARNGRIVRRQKPSVNVPTKILARLFWIWIAPDAGLDFLDTKGGAAEGIGKTLVLLEVHIIDEVIPEPYPVVDGIDEFWHLMGGNLSSPERCPR